MKILQPRYIARDDQPKYIIVEKNGNRIVRNNGLDNGYDNGNGYNNGYDNGYGRVQNGRMMGGRLGRLTAQQRDEIFDAPLNSATNPRLRDELIMINRVNTGAAGATGGAAQNTGAVRPPIIVGGDMPDQMIMTGNGGMIMAGDADVKNVVTVGANGQAGVQQVIDLDYPVPTMG